MKNKHSLDIHIFGIIGMFFVVGIITIFIGNHARFTQIVSAEGNNTYQVCHKGETLNVATEGAYNGHLGHGDTDGACQPVEIPGCIDPEAINHLPSATVDDGSCEYDTPVENTEPLCTDTIDNDGDELIDQADPDCAEFYTTDPVIGCMDLQATNYNLLATQDTDPSSCVYDEDPAICSDGIDNDEDGQTDYPNDPGCSSADDTDETNEVEPSVCTVVSDETNVVEGGTNAVETWNHVTWYDENILGSGAKWIWELFNIANPTVDTTKVFVKTFTLNSVPSSATMQISADNGFILEINGTVITDKSGIQDNFSGNQSYVVSNLVAGENTIRVTVTNFKQQISTPESNPAGLLYKLTIDDEGCVDVPPVDVCTNLEGTQTQVPQGYVLSEGMCVLDQVDKDPAVCEDGIDNDEDGQTDYPNDPGCSSADDTDETNEDTEEPTSICSDGIDNDGDDKIDYPSDPGCSSADDTDETDPQSNSGGRGGSRRGSVAGNSTGEVLGVSTTCGIYMDQYIRLGYANNKDQVIKLQTFLKDYLKINLAIDGVYGKGTESAVRQFQAMHADEVLTPWGINAPTGIVFKTTVRKINNIMCPELNLAIPAILIPWSRDPEMKKR